MAIDHAHKLKKQILQVKTGLTHPFLWMSSKSKSRSGWQSLLSSSRLGRSKETAHRVLKILRTEDMNVDLNLFVLHAIKREEIEMPKFILKACRACEDFTTWHRSYILDSSSLILKL